MIIPDVSLEKMLWKKGFINIAGVDEAGKGPWAGPVTAASVVIHSEKQIIPYVKDSKTMTAKQREKAFSEICKNSSAFGIGVVGEKEIDIFGIQIAVRKAMQKALKNLIANFGIDISYVLIDGSKSPPLSDYNFKRLKKGGSFHYSISAASVLAKVTRDRLMKKLANKYPQYGFDKHVGYGTKTHLKALQRYGICPIHRKSYAPIKKLISSGI